MTKQEIIEFMKKSGLAFNKNLGQNFLIDKNILEMIVNTSIPLENTVEIGAGLGVLTNELCKNSKKVYTYEIDSGLSNILQNKNIENLEVLHQDFLKDDINARFGNTEISIVANVPYYITTPILEKLFESKLNINKIVLLVQKEVAQRVCGKEKSAFWHFLHYHAKPEYIKTVSRNCFHPSPNVDSAILKLTPTLPPVDCDKEKLFKIIRAGFQERRKQLANSLYNILGIKKELVGNKLLELGYTATARAEELELEDFEKLTELL